MEAHDKETGAMSFETTKIRGGRELQFTSPIDWDTLRISSIPMERPPEKEVIKKAGGKREKKEQQAPTSEKSGDTPW
jgi:hypothetical protein